MFRAVLKEKKGAQIELRGARGVQPSQGLAQASYYPRIYRDDHRYFCRC